MCKSRVLLVSTCAGTVLGLALMCASARVQSTNPTPGQLYPTTRTMYDRSRADVSAPTRLEPGSPSSRTKALLALGAMTVAGLGGLVGLLVLCSHHRVANAMRARSDVVLAERARIARELHDTLLPSFLGVTLQLHSVQRTLASRPGDAAATLSRALENAHAAMRSARRVVWDMRSPELDGQTLPAALARAARAVIGDAQIELRFAVCGQERRLPRADEITTLRIGCEAVMNVVKHADARVVALELHYEPRTLALIVCDDGRGFAVADAESARRDGHWGIIGMRERAASLGGTLEIESAPGRGTWVSAVIALNGIRS